MNLADFIVQHQNDDISDLVLHRDRYPDVDVALAAECIAARRKLRYKVPEWYDDAGLICPVALSAEQCSSTATARYKAAVAEEACRSHACGGAMPGPGALYGTRPGPLLLADGIERRPALPTSLRIADLTGGLGVDCWQFSKVAESILYNEMNPLLFEAAKANLGRLGCGNVEFSNLCIDADTLPGLLDSFRPDLLFADPARRSEGRKVFLPEDCSPDVLALQDIVLDRGCKMLLKLSPMADISLMLKRFHCVKSIHIVETHGECKELLLLLEPGFGGSPEMTVAIVDDPSSYRVATFDYPALATDVPTYIAAMPEPGQILFEPGPALMKSGAMNALSSSLGLPELGPSAHYLCLGEDRLEDDKVHRALDGFGKLFKVEEAATFGKASLRDFAVRWPGAEVTARALPLSSDELRLKIASLRKKAPRVGSPSALGIPPEISSGTHSSGTGTHLFGVGTSIGRLLIAARRL